MNIVWTLFAFIVVAFVVYVIVAICSDFDELNDDESWP